MKRKSTVKILLIAIAIQMISSHAKAWNEEKTDSLGQVITFHSVKNYHSTFHYDLTLLLAVKMGFSPDTAELLARYCSLVDQINPKSGYPYPMALNDISIPDTIPGWCESLAGTERGNIFTVNSFSEWAPQYWHFPIKSNNDTISGGMVYGAYPQPNSISFRSSPYYWRVPLVPSLNKMMSWALYGTGEPGNPDKAPVIVEYFDNMQNQYMPVQPGSLQAFAIYLHVLADSYSHEHCMVEDTLRSHPPDDDFCGLNYHSLFEFAYDDTIVAEPHAVPCIQAVWRALREYKRVTGLNCPALWTNDNNGFQDGDGIPDELENDQDSDFTETFIEKWISPTTEDLTGDDIINHFDQTTWRILVCNLEYCSINFTLQPVAFVAEGEVYQANPEIDYYDSLYWSTNGDGFFGNLNDPNAGYHYGLNDSVQGNVALTLHILNFRGCTEEMTREVILSIVQKQIVNLPSGWSGISMFLQPGDPSVESILQPVAGNVIILQNLTGFYMPGQNLNTLNNWDTQQGYQIKTTQATELIIAGNHITDNSVQLIQGWNMIPVLGNCFQQVEEVFAGNIDNIEIIRESVGMKMFWPNKGINTLEFLKPGNSYLVLVNTPFSIDFPDCEN